MTNKKSTKRALLSSILAMVLCCSMLIGTTFAWFTDNVTSKGNIIKTGTLNVEMYWSEGKDAPTDDAWKDASKGAIFNNTLWEPGYTEARHLKIANEGTLALKYQLAIIPNGDVSELADVIDVYYQSPAKQISADRQNLGTKVGTLADVIRTGIHDGALAAETAYTATIVLKMQESAGNKYQDKSIGTSFSIQLIATQMASENDSFGPNYDENAWAKGMVVHTEADLKAALENGNNVALAADITLTAPLEIAADSTKVLNLNGKKLSGATTKDEGALLVNNGTLTLVGGTMTNTTLNGAAVINNNGTLTLKNVTVQGAPIDATGYPEYAVTTYGKLTVENGTTVLSDRGALRTYAGAELVINGGEFVVSNAAAGRNMTLHTVYATGSGATVTINGGKFVQNHVSNGGASVICPAGATINVYGGEFSDSMDESSWQNTANFQNYMGYSAPVNVYGGTYTDNSVMKWVADGYQAVKNTDGTYTVLKGDVAVSNSDALIDAINAGKKNIALAAGDYALRFTNNTAFNLDGATLVGLDGTKLSISSSEASYGRIQADNVTFENITFTNGTVGATGKATYNDCTFEGVLECASSNAAETYVNDCVIKGYIHTATDMNAGAAFVTNSKLAGAEYNAPNGVTFTNCEIGEINIWGGDTVLNGCTYTTIVNMGSGSVLVDGVNLVTNNAQLTAVIASGATKVLLADGDYDLNGNQKNGLTLIGVGENVNMANTTKYAGGKAVGAITKSVTLQNMTITNTVYTMENGGNATFDKVYFAAGFRQGYGKNVTFNECTFGSNSEGYALHFQTDSASDGGNVTLNGCTFEGGKVHLGGKRAYTFENCEFAAGTDFQVWSTITLNGCTVDGVAVTDANIATLFPKLDLTKVTIQ